jgi:hypothetical protein
MAAAATGARAVAETVCPVCLEAFQGGREALHVPLLLGCGHTFCRNCLAAIVARDPETKQPPPLKAVECPTCRQPTALPSNGVAALPKNFALIALLPPPRDRGDTAAAAAAAAPCEGCKKKPATVFCPGCRWQFCGDCDERMHSFAATQAHKRVPVADRMAVEELRCLLHRKKLRLYCKNCKGEWTCFSLLWMIHTDTTLFTALCCASCEKSAHKGHDIVLKDEAAADIKSGMKADLDRLQEVVKTRESGAKALGAVSASHDRAAE